MVRVLAACYSGSGKREAVSLTDRTPVDSPPPVAGRLELPECTTESRWKALFEVAEVHNLVFPLTRALKDSGISIPDPIKVDCEHALLAWKVKRRAYERLLLRVSELASRNRIPLLAVKGPQLAERLYLFPEDRSFRDLDLLVPPDAFARFADILLQAGFVATASPFHGLSREAVTAWELPMTFSPEDAPGLHLDLHSNLIHRLEPYRTPVSPVWDRAIPWRDGLLGLADEDFLQFLMVHALKHGYLQLQSFLDLHRAAAVPGIHRTFAMVLQRSASHGFGTLVATAAELGRRTYGTIWPAESSTPAPAVRAADRLETALWKGFPMVSERVQLLLQAFLLLDSRRRFLKYLRISLFRPLETIPSRPYNAKPWTNPWAGLVRAARSIRYRGSGR